VGNLDLSELSYEELLVFFFDRAAPGPGEHVTSFSDEGSECEWSRPEAAVSFLTQIWMIVGADFDLIRNLWDNAIPLEQRIECIRSMYFVYSDFVAKSDVRVMEKCFDMWWDLIGDSFWCQLNFFDRGKNSLKVEHGETSKLDSDSRALLDAMFETLERILGHLHHPKVRRLVQKYIDDNRDDITDDGLKWMEQCRDGNVM
jgi:hypothetical protein